MLTKAVFCKIKGSGVISSNKRSNKRNLFFNFNTTLYFENGVFQRHMNDLQKSLEDRIKLLRKHRDTSQPFIVAVGNLKQIDACYVIIETVKYKYPNILAAIDAWFKSFYALDLKYPAESKLGWIFLERNIYGLSSSVKNPPAVSSLLSDIQSVSVQSDNEESEESD